MSAYLLFEEFHLTVLVSADLEESACEAIHRILVSRPFHTALDSAVRQVVRQYSDLDPIRVRISH
ncbi:MAG TPA: hypothetical protein VH592_12640 [Gemmataceae bacterium]|jgi:hypothetical protein